MKMIILFTLFSIHNVSYVAGGNVCGGINVISKQLERDNNVGLTSNDIIVPKTDQNFPGESSCSNENRQENLEELYHVGILQLLNTMPTLDVTDVSFGSTDIKLLTEECNLDENCLNEKKASVKKYRQKMQAIQCINGLFVLKVLEELKTIKHVLKHQRYLKSMLSLLSMAKWDAYDWQIEMFTFVEGLASSTVNLRLYKEHFKNNKEIMRETMIAFVSLCIDDKYLPYLSDTGSETTTISGLLEDVYSLMELLYKSELDACRSLEYYTVPNLTLQHLYLKHDFIVDWSMYDLELETINVKRQLLQYASAYNRQQLYQEWELDPIGGNKYNALISECIHLRLVYFAWFHLYTYRTLKSRQTEVNERLSQIWNALVEHLKRALRLFRINGNIYWSAINVMMDDLNNVSIEELAAREDYTRNCFCQAADELGLASASDIDRQLKQLNVSEDQQVTYDNIETNAKMLNFYTCTVLYTLRPVDGAFIRLIVSAERNETFVMH